MMKEKSIAGPFPTHFVSVERYVQTALSHISVKEKEVLDRQPQSGPCIGTNAWVERVQDQ